MKSLLPSVATLTSLIVLSNALPQNDPGSNLPSSNSNNNNNEPHIILNDGEAILEIIENLPYYYWHGAVQSRGGDGGMPAPETLPAHITIPIIRSVSSGSGSSPSSPPPTLPIRTAKLANLGLHGSNFMCVLETAGLPSRPFNEAHPFDAAAAAGGPVDAWAVKCFNAGQNNAIVWTRNRDAEPFSRTEAFPVLMSGSTRLATRYVTDAMLVVAPRTSMTCRLMWTDFGFGEDDAGSDRADGTDVTDVTDVTDATDGADGADATDGTDVSSNTKPPKYSINLDQGRPLINTLIRFNEIECK